MKNADPVRDGTKANDKLPRGHAYIRVRNRGYRIDINYPELDSAEADQAIRAMLAVVTEDSADEKTMDRSEQVWNEEIAWSKRHE
jgi:hypothetical protein